jgi:hypothetical protein
MAELLARADHEKLVGNAARRAPGDTSAVLENEYQRVALASGAGAAATARTALAAIIVPRPDGR